MKKKQFDKLAELLYSRGYKKYGQTWHNEDYVIAKGFHKEDNKCSATDVYQGKTTLDITYRDGVPIDSVVVFKYKEK